MSTKNARITNMKVQFLETPYNPGVAAAQVCTGPNLAVNLNPIIVTILIDSHFKNYIVIELQLGILGTSVYPYNNRDAQMLFFRVTLSYYTRHHHYGDASFYYLLLSFGLVYT